jgi:hypothetical protein
LCSSSSEASPLRASCHDRSHMTSYCSNLHAGCTSTRQVVIRYAMSGHGTNKGRLFGTPDSSNFRSRLTNPIPNPTSRHDRRANHHDPEESSWRRCSHYARISSAGSCPCAQIFLLTAFAFVYSERNLEAGVKPTSRLEKGLASPRRRATVGTTAGVTCSIANAAMSEALSMRRKCRLSIAYACECV